MQLSNWKGEIRREVTGLLREYLQEEREAGYTLADARECAALIEGYVDAVSAAAEEAEILAAVEQTVLALNELNRRTGGAMLETGVREAICCIFQGVALEAGLPDTGTDVTQAWRTW